MRFGLEGRNAAFLEAIDSNLIEVVLGELGVGIGDVIRYRQQLLTQLFEPVPALQVAAKASQIRAESREGRKLGVVRHLGSQRRHDGLAVVVGLAACSLPVIVARTLYALIQEFDLRLLAHPVKELHRPVLDGGGKVAHGRGQRLVSIGRSLSGRGETRPACRIGLAIAAQ